MLDVFVQDDSWVGAVVFPFLVSPSNAYSPNVLQFLILY